MNSGYPAAYSKHRCLFSSAILLLTLLALSFPHGRSMTCVSNLVIIGVPLLTFSVAAPPRIPFSAQFLLLMRGLESFLLGALLMLRGRRQDAKAVRIQFRQYVESTYLNDTDAVPESFTTDPERLHHARRLAFLGSLMAVGAGLMLPITYPTIFTYGEGGQAIFVIALDVIVLTVASRMVLERFMIRLWESSHVLPTNTATMRSIRTFSFCLLGGALGSIAALVIVIAGALACAIETSWLPMAHEVHFIEPVFWFIQHTAPLALPYGILLGTILGFGMAFTKSVTNGSDPV
jgi:hypothetical protein